MKNKAISLILVFLMTFSLIIPTTQDVYAVSYDAKTVVDLALSKVGTNYANGYCLRFVKEMFATAYGFTSSDCCAYKYGSSYIDSTSRNNIPIGASVFFSGSSKTCSTCGNKCGHIGIYVGNDYVVHGWSGKIVKYKIDRIINAGYPYRGWGWHGNVQLTSDVPIETTPTNSTNPDDYTMPTRDLFYTSPVKTGSDVKWVQSVLYNLGYSVVVDGSFGPSTRDVIKQFQADYGLDVDGSCGPATRSKLLEQWNKKKNGNINITLHAWLSNEEYGDVPDKFISRDRVYLCYELVDSDTWQKINSLVDKNYTAKVTLYNPDGSVHYTASFDNDDASWISIVPKQAGLYRGTVEVTGEVVRTVNVSFGLEYDPTIDLSKSSLNLNLNGTNTTTINITFGGGLPGEYRIRWQDANSVVSGSWGEWDGMTIPLTVTGLKRGTSELKIMVLEDYTGNLTPVKSVSIPVTVTANSYTISYNANGGSGAPASQTKYYGTDITLSSTVPTRFGYTFLGWSTSSSATSATYLPGANFSGNSNTTLYAVWKAATTLSIGTTYSADINFASKENYYTFTPSSSGNFTFKSTGSLDSQVYIYNSSGTLIKSNDDIGDSDRNFSLSLDLTGGTKYYVKVKAYSDKTGTTSFNVTGKYTVNYNANGGSGAPSAQAKIHGAALTLSSSKPTRTGYTFTGWNTKADGTGTNYSAGGSYTANTGVTLYAMWKANPTVLSSNSSNNAVISDGGEMKYYTFTPTETGTYVIYSTGSEDTKVYLYNSSGSELANNDDGGEGNNFRLQYNLTAGTTYKYGVRYYNSSKTGTIPFKFGKVYTVTYNANGGSGVPSSQTKDYGTALTLSSTAPTRTGYTFLGWSTSSTATSATYQPGDTFTTNANTTLHAVWKANTYTVIFYTVGGTCSTDNKTVTYDSTYGALPNPIKNGCIFDGWYTLSTGGTKITSSTKVTITANQALYAQWKGNTYSVTFDSCGGTCSTSSMNVVYDSLYGELPVPTKTGYSFDGWYTAIAGQGGTHISSSTTVYIAENHTLYAHWTANTYTVKYNANGGSGTMANSSHRYDVSKALTSNSFAKGGYTFVGWATSSSATTATYTNGQSVKNLTSTNGATINLYAVWSEIPTYTINYNANGGSGAPSSQTKTKDVTLTLSSTQPTRTGYTFLGWSTSSTATSATYQPGGSFTTNADTPLYAVWKANTYSVKYNANGGSGTMSNSSHTYDVSKSLTTNGFSRTGYTFLGWSTSSSATTATYTNGQSVKNLTSTNSGTVNLYAVWKLNDTALSVNSSNNASISTGGEKIYYTFTPTESGTYVIYSTGSTDTKVYLYNSLGTELDNDDDDGTDRNFRLQYNLTAGTTYRFAVGYYSASTTGTIPFKFGKVYTITYNANGGSSAPSSQTKDYGIALTLSSTKPTRSGYTFLGWSTSSTATTSTYSAGGTYSSEANVTLYAVWHKHSYTSRVTTAATCTTAGVRTYTCSVCSDSYTESIAALDHNYSTSYTVDTPATCTTAGSKSQHCSRCSSKQNVTAIPATGHSYTSKVTTAATCTATGVKTYTCSTCSHSYTETIAKLGHNYSTSYTVDTPATCKTAGSKSQHCTRCTAKQNVTVIPATGHNYVNGTCSSCSRCCYICFTAT